MTFETYEGPPPTFRVVCDWEPEELSRVIAVLERYLDEEREHPFERIDAMTLSPDYEGGVDIVVTAGDKQARVNITKTCIQRAKIWPELRHLAKMLGGAE